MRTFRSDTTNGSKWYTPSSTDVSSIQNHSPPNTVTNSTPALQKQINLIESKGYVPGEHPSVETPDGYGNTLYAWGATLKNGDGSVNWVFFFDGSKYLGTDTAKPDARLGSIVSNGMGKISVTYDVYRSGAPVSSPSGKPFTITYQWNGSRLIALQPY